MLPLLVTVSDRNAKTNPFGIVAPRRFNMMGCGIATTSALIRRAPGGHATTCGGSDGGALGAGSASVFATAGGVAVSSFVVAAGIAGILAGVSGTAALGSIVAFSTTAVAGV